MQEQAERLGISMQRISGIDGRSNLPTGLTPQFPDSKMSSGEVGCYASHLIVMRQIVEDGHAAAIILEDDVSLDPRFMTVAAAAISAAPRGWDIIHLCTHFKKAAWYPIADLGGHTLVGYSRLPVNTVAYVISRRGCGKFLAERPRIRPVDMEFRYAWLSGLDICGVYSAPAVHLDNFITSIDATSRTNPPRKRLWAPGLLSQAYGVFYIKWKLGLVGTLWCWGAGLIGSAHKRFAKRRRNLHAPAQQDT
jgi:glycosyl transferase family 25